jgi:hypothetical protein
MVGSKLETEPGLGRVIRTVGTRCAAIWKLSAYTTGYAKNRGILLGKIVIVCYGE